MVVVILKGIGLGLLLSVLVGPSFFMLIDTSLTRGFKRAFVMDLGITMSDILWIIILYFSTASQLLKVIESPMMRLVGGSLFFLFGLSSFIIQNSTIKFSTGLKTQFTKGFMVNFLNPSVFIFWLASVSLVASEYRDQTINVFVFFAGTIGTTFAIDLLKIIAAGKIRGFLSGRQKNRIKLATGVIMMGFGLYLIYKFFEMR